MTVGTRSSKAQKWFDLMREAHMKAQAESVRTQQARLRAGSATVALNMTTAELQSLTGLSVENVDPAYSVCVRVSPQDRVATGPDSSSPLVFIDAPFFHRRVPLSHLPSGILERMTQVALSTAPEPDMTYPVDFMNQDFMGQEDGWAMNMLAMRAFIVSGRSAPETLSEWKSLPQCSMCLADDDADVWRVSAMGAETYATGEVLWDLYEQSVEQLKAQP